MNQHAMSIKDTQKKFHKFDFFEFKEKKRPTYENNIKFTPPPQKKKNK